MDADRGWMIRCAKSRCGYTGKDAHCFYTLEVDILELVFDIEKIAKNAGLLTKQYDPQCKSLSLTT